VMEALTFGFFAESRPASPAFLLNDILMNDVLLKYLVCVMMYVRMR
jgi:hypothetical protein